MPRLLYVIAGLMLWSATEAAAEDCTVLGAGAVAGASGTEVSEVVTAFEAAISGFPSLRAAIDAVRPELCLVEGVREAVGEYAPLENRIRISTGLPRGLKLAILIHESRHVEQLSRGFCPSNDLSMRENARMVFAVEADASAVSLNVAWALREAGDRAVWDALAAWDMQTDIAQSFAAEMRDSGDIARATERAFEQWYLSETRREAYYVASCSDYLARQEKAHALPRYGILPEDFLANLCNLPDGTPYECRDPEDPFGR